MTMMKISATPFFLLLLAVHAAWAQDETDRSSLSAEEILIKIFDRTGGFSWTSHNNWLGENVCLYEGITCYTDQEDFAGHVREVDLAANNLVGTLPSDVFSLPYLETLIVRDNPDLFVEFDEVGQAQFLKNLVVSSTHTDSLQGIEGAAASLQTLHITSLGLPGPIPDAIFQLTNLRGLFANFNAFSGRLSSAIGNLYYLTDLYLYENNLEGPIPSEIGNLVNLQTLSLGDNAWSGSLPTGIDKCTGLRTISIQRSLDNLKGSGLTGGLLGLSNMPNLNHVDFSNQKLSGAIPDLFLNGAANDDPIQVDLRGNQLSGALPLILTEKKKLTIFLADNRISALPDFYCAQVPQWMGGAVATTGCNSILCPPATFAPEGRQTAAYVTCQACASNVYFGSTSCESAPTTDEFERKTLISMYDRMGGPYWKTSTNWLSPAESVCMWFGVSCNNAGQVIAIRLSNNGLTKSLPPDVFRLPQLRVLELAENTLDFQFDGIGNAQNLQTLDLTQTDLTSLNGIEGLKQTGLQKLALGSNIIQGGLPDALFDLANLEELDVSHNSFTGSLSTRVGELINLKKLYIFGNSFSSALPTELGQLNQLTELVAGENNFSGNLPTQLNNLADLQVLSLHQTTTTGAIGGGLPAFENLQRLTSLKLAGNALEGGLPQNFLQNTLEGSNRIEVMLGDNSLSGIVPASWADRFANLFIDLTGNEISGFGDGICGKTAWMDGKVSLYGCDAILCPAGKFNEFGRQSTAEGVCRDCDKVTVLGATACQGLAITPGGEEIETLQELYDATHGDSWIQNTGWKTTSNYCSWFGISCNLAGRVVKITLADNGLTGSPPASVFGLNWLQELDLGNNQISFSFGEIENASSLTKLTLSNLNMNSLEGLENANSLLELEMDDNDIGGTFPTQFLSLTNLQRLSANFNNIAGRIPASISSLKSLTELSLFHNRLTGPLPASLGGVTGLRVLGLSENNFEGTIPPSYNDLVNLEVLAIQREGGTDGSEGNIGVNQGASEDEGKGLSGPLPAFDRLKKLRQLYLGVNALTGAIPGNFLAGVDDANADIVVDLTSNRLTGGIPGALARFEKLTIFVAGNHLTEEVPSGVCRQTGWMYGQVASSGCNAILCPKNTFGDFGRQTPTSGCSPCPSDESTNYLGSFECRNSEEHASAEERSLLEEFYHQTKGDAWLARDFWLDPDVSICLWYGITCDSEAGESVQSIDLMQNGLTGRVPSSVFSLPNLKELNVASNAADVSFSGIMNAQKLEYLNIDAMELSSLDGLGKAPNLLQLHAANNNLERSSFSEILPLSSVEVLYLSQNNFGGNIPNEATNWRNLKSFSCESCGFEGFLPAVFGNWTKLERLNLADNEYNGPFERTVETLENIEYIDISKQRTYSNIGLTGFLPAFSDNLKLGQLYLQENEFFGTIPADFLSSTGATNVIVDISRNLLNGTIPTTLNRFEDSSFLFSDNMIDLVPTTLCSLGWNDQPQGSGDCSFILCPSLSYNGIGRATAELPCEPCPSAVYAGTTSCGDMEREALKELFYGTEGSQWIHKDGWGSHTSVCEWYGVTCDSNGLVQILDLRGNNLVGNLSPQIWLLTRMEELDLSDNAIEVSSFEKIGDAASLTTLKLSNNNVKYLNGIGGATRLKNFHCTSCEIHGPVPMELYSLTELERLFLNYNHLTGELAYDIAYLVNLRELYLFSNLLSGGIPARVGSFLGIEVVSLGHNRFSGTIPATYSAMPNLRVFSAEYEEVVDSQMSFNQPYGLIGNLQSFNGNPKLRELYLAGNAIGGTIPSDFLESVDDLSATIHVDISSNAIRHTIPTELARFDDLRLLASDNWITEVPPALCDKTAWMDGLVASDCDALLCPPGTYSASGRRTTSDICEICDHRGAAEFFGTTECGNVNPKRTDQDMLKEIYETAGGPGWTDNTGWESDASFCTWFGITCTKNSDGEDAVSEISLPSNNLVNRVSSIVFHLPSLRLLNLSGNAVSMSFSDAVKAQNLEELDVSNTQIVSMKGVGGARSLTQLNLSRNELPGQEIPEEIFSLKSLKSLNLSRCGLVGSVSSTISELSALEELDISRNDLAGTIPDSWNRLAKLKILNLSDNIFFGEIPTSLTTLASLESLGLSVRTRSIVGLSGTLPDFATLSELRYLDLGANSLTGTVPSTLLSGISNPQLQLTVLLDSNMLHGEVPIGLDRFTRLNIDLTDNEIESIPAALCEMTLWWDGDVGQHECDAILCPAGKFNEVGRQDSADNRCEDCPGEENSRILGRTECPFLQKQAAKEILVSLYEATGGNNWKIRKNWNSAEDICSWHGITCQDDIKVETINLGSNNLSGRVPKEIFELVGLKNLWLHSNPLEFSFEGIENAKTLTNLQLDQIGLTSLDGIGKAASLTYLDVRLNAFEGTVTTEIASLTSLETLLLSENNFFGPFPSFESNRRLSYLDAGGNGFTGPLPSLSIHPNLRRLNVAGNQLNGDIPEDLLTGVDSSKPVVLNLARNKFSGTLPSSLARFDDLTLFISANEITGIAEELCQKERWNGGDVERFGCDAILCPPDSYSSDGRASSTSGDCLPCPSADFYGHTVCINNSGSTGRAVVYGATAATIFSIILQYL